MGGYFHTIQGASTGNLDKWTAPITEYTLYYQQAPIRESPLQIRAARGEFESFQLVVQSPTEQSLPVSATPLTHEGGTHIIPVENIELFRVDYVDIIKISGYFGRSGSWSDPLYPITLGETIEFPAETNQPLWIRIEVPGGAFPGLYTGTIMIGKQQHTHLSAGMGLHTDQLTLSLKARSASIGIWCWRNIRERLVVQPNPVMKIWSMRSMRPLRITA